MTFKHLILPAAILDYMPATYKNCVFFTIKQNYCVRVPWKHLKKFKRNVDHCWFIMQPWEHPINFLKAIINTILRAT